MPKMFVKKSAEVARLHDEEEEEDADRQRNEDDRRQSALGAQRARTWRRIWLRSRIVLPT